MDDKIVIEKLNEVFLRIRCDISQSLEIRQYFTCLAPNFQFHPRFRAKIWDGKICFYNYIYIFYFFSLVHLDEEFRGDFRKKY